MGDLLEFPTPKAQGMAFLESQLREILTAKGADDQLINFAVDQLVSRLHTVKHRMQFSRCSSFLRRFLDNLFLSNL